MRCVGLYGGALIGVRGTNILTLYDWENGRLVRRIEITPRLVIWSDSGQLTAITTESSFFVLRYDASVVAGVLGTNQPVPEEGIEEAFTVLGEVSEGVTTGLWVGEVFVFTTPSNRYRRRATRRIARDQRPRPVRRRCAQR